MIRVACYLILVLTALCTSPSAAQLSCGPSALGEPCAQGGLASAGATEPGLSLGVGNPIHLATGNKYQKELDFPSSMAAPGLEIVRHYNAHDRRPSRLGPGWSLSYDTRLFFAAAHWQIVQADGSRVTFSAAKGQPVANAFGTLERINQQWLWQWPTGRRLWFDAGGFLVRVHDADGTRLDIHRHPAPGPLAHAIARVTAGHGLALAFGYDTTGPTALLLHIDTPLGRFEYEHEGSHTPPVLAGGTPRLVALSRPDGMQRRYLYERERQAGNAYALTGIEIVSADRKKTVRLNTWAYDAQGRAVLSASGPAGNELVIRYVRPPTPQATGLTTVTQVGQKETWFEYAVKGGRHVLVSVHGALCPGCATSGSQATYDDDGRLRSINGTHIQRDKFGQIQTLRPRASGWPGLTLSYQGQGHRTSWGSALTGNERMAYDDHQRPVQRHFANGDTVNYRYDGAGRPIEVHERNHNASHTTRLQWQGQLLRRIDHPNEIETRHYDNERRLAGRTVERPATSGSAPLHYSETLAYDSQHRLLRHQLPEGGALHYRWSGQRLAGIVWHDALGRVHTVIDTVPGRAGYRYGNGLHLETTLNHRHQLSHLALTREATPKRAADGGPAVGAANGSPTWLMRLDYDEGGNVRQEQHEFAHAGHAEAWSYAYDAKSRLIGAQDHASEAAADWYAWNDDGSLAARRTQGVTTRPAIARDASGLPLTAEEHTLGYGPGRRLTTAQRDGAPEVSWRHNAFGQRIARHHNGNHHSYFFLDNKLVAEAHEQLTPARADTSSPQAPQIRRRYIYAQHVLVGFIDFGQDGKARASDGTLYFVHADSIGAPRLVTDAAQTLRWLARYTPTGAATRVQGDMTLDLRLPGQIHDATTGWHDNLLRTYSTGLGQYLEPDPLGPLPGHQALGYANQQPRRHVDPLGLLLFAFDGTRNAPETRSNVWKMSQYYQDGPVYYHAGPGSPLYMDSDALVAWRAGQIIDAQWLSLLNALERYGDLREPLAIDIIGFSRGAALARHFGNLINQHVDRGLFSYTDTVRGLISACVDLRFIGLFDTVAQFGVAGSQNGRYDLTIASAWQWVAHAVALHERRWLFPLTSVGEGQQTNTIEAPFIGAHADIGGGVLVTDQGEARSSGDLSDVALNWMVWQARAASLHFGTLAEQDTEVLNPILHDQRLALSRYIQNGDRSVDMPGVHAPGGSKLLVYQDDHARLGREQRQATEALLTRRENWLTSASHEVADVDMDGYAQWLHDELGWQALPA
jgi:RHS repeat-associated protein